MVEPQSRDVARSVSFLLNLDRLKEVRRQNPIANGGRRERTAEHSWHVAVAAVIFAPFSAEPIDVGKAVQLAVLHDLPEVVVGDTFVYGPRVAARREREEHGLRALLATLGEPQAQQIHAAWSEYEYETTPEGRYVMALDVMLPVFLNLAAGHESSWIRHGVTADAVRGRIESVRSAIPELADAALEAVEEAVKGGLLRP